MTRTATLILACVGVQDALWLVAQQPDVINGYEKVVLTPNTAEFEQLCSCSSVPVDLQVSCC